MIPAGCRGRWREWNCKFWFPVHLTCWTLLAVMALSFCLLLTHYPSIRHSQLAPSQLTGSSVVQLTTGSNPLWWFSELGLGVANCTRSMLVFRESNCSVLNLAKKCSGNTFRLNHWLGLIPLYLLEDSYLTIAYGSADGSRGFIVLKSIAAQLKYKELCVKLGDANEYGDCFNHKTVSRLCVGNDIVDTADTIDSDDAIDPALRHNFWCYLNVQGMVSLFHVNQSDFYQLAFQSSVVPQIRGSRCYYDHSTLFSLENAEVHNLTNTSLRNGDYIMSTSFSLTKSFWFEREESWCAVLQTQCNNSRGFPTLQGVTYSLRRRRDVLIFPGALVLVGVVLLVSLVGVQCGCVSRRGRKQHIHCRKC